MPERIAVFFDWQNVYMTAREAFGWTRMPGEYGNFCPHSLARILAAGNGRGADGELVLVEINRGLPSQKRDHVGYAANRRQSAAWTRKAPGIVRVRTRPLRYPRGQFQSPVEKGVDVNLALGVLENVLTRACDVAIVFSHDQDLLPVPETVARLVGAKRVETASWQSANFNRRLRVTGHAIYHHAISEQVFSRVETRVNFAHQT